MATNIYIVFLVCALSYWTYNNILMHRKDKVVPSPYKMGENPLLFSFNVLIIILIVLGAYFFITDDEVSILLIIYYVFAPISLIQTIILNYSLYKRSKDKKVIFNTIMSIVFIIISWLIVLNAGRRYR